MRYHPNLVLASAQALHAIFIRGKYTDQVVASLLKSNPKWGSRDRKLLAETTYSIVRWKRYYMHVSEVVEPIRRNGLLRLIVAFAIHRNIDLPEMKELVGIDRAEIGNRLKQDIGIRAIEQSIPDWLDAYGVEALGESRWTKELEALNSQAPVVLRVNSLLADRNEVQKRLAWEKIESSEFDKIPHALQLSERKKVTQTKVYKKGYFEIQDAASQLVAPALDPQPGEIVIDTCAGAGGKTLHLACLMENKGTIMAWDIHHEKLRELKLRAARNGVSIIETKLISPGENLGPFSEIADKVLIDAPCSGLGVLRRRPDVKWKLKPGDIKNLVKAQAEMLQLYSSMLKPGGTLVYATCSILPQENEVQIAAFLKTEKGGDFTLKEEETIWPSEFGFDGFYIATLVKK